MTEIIAPFRRPCNIPLLHNHGQIIDIYPCPFYKPCPFHNTPSELLMDLVNRQIRHGLVNGASAADIVENIQAILRAVRHTRPPNRA